MQTDVQVPVPSDLINPFSYNPLAKSHLHFRMVDGVIRVFEPPPVDTTQQATFSSGSAEGPDAVTPSEQAQSQLQPNVFSSGGAAGPSPLRRETDRPHRGSTAKKSSASHGAVLRMSYKAENQVVGFGTAPPQHSAGGPVNTVALSSRTAVDTVVVFPVALGKFTGHR